MPVKINLWSHIQSADFVLEYSLFGDTKLTKNADLDKYKYIGYGTGFDANEFFSLFDGSDFGKNVIIFGANMSSLVHINDKKQPCNLL